MSAIGANIYGGLITKTQWKQGKGVFSVGQKVRVPVVNGVAGNFEFVSVKLNAATWLNGTCIILDGTGAPGSAVTTASSNAAPTQGARLGILVFSSATLTQTLSATGYGWAQIYGEAPAYVSASVSTPGLALTPGTSGQLIALGTSSVSAVGCGITLATATAAAGGITRVFLQYPSYQPFGA